MGTPISSPAGFSGAKVAEKADVVIDTSLRNGKETILVAEDEDALREMVVQVLKIQGYYVLEAASGTHALEVWNNLNDRCICCSRIW